MITVEAAHDRVSLHFADNRDGFTAEIAPDVARKLASRLWEVAMQADSQATLDRSVSVLVADCGGVAQ